MCNLRKLWKNSHYYIFQKRFAFYILSQGGYTLWMVPPYLILFCVNQGGAYLKHFLKIACWDGLKTCLSKNCIDNRSSSCPSRPFPMSAARLSTGQHNFVLTNNAEQQIFPVSQPTHCLLQPHISQKAEWTDFQEASSTIS